MASIVRKTQKDIGNYEAKLIGPFTSRQVACIGIGAVPTVIAIAIAKSAGADAMTFLGLALIFMAIPCFFAFGQKFCYGMKPENFLADYLYYHSNSAKERLYKTKTLDDILYEEQLKEELKKDPKAAAKAAKEKAKTKNGKPYKPRQIVGYHYYE